MSLGNGISFTNLPTKNAGPPFDPASVFNGLSVFTDGRIQLGDFAEANTEPGVLLADTFLNTNGNNFIVTDDIIGRTLLQGPSIILQDFAGNDFLFVDTTGHATIGDINNIFSKTTFEMTPTTISMRIPLGAVHGAVIFQGSGGMVQIGDVLEGHNKTKIKIDENAAKQITFQADNLFTFQNYNLTGRQRFFEIDLPNGDINLGDIDNQFTGLKLTLLNSTNDARVTGEYMASGAGFATFLILSPNGRNFAIGDTGSFGNGTNINCFDEDQGVNPLGETIYLTSNRGIATNNYPAGAFGRWKLGQVTAGAVALDPANYLDTIIDGNRVKILIAS